MSRVPETKSRLEQMRARKKITEVVFNAAPGSRLLAAAMCGLIAVLFVIHQTQIDGVKLLLRGFAVSGAVVFGVLAWYFFRRGSRRGPVLRLDKQGFGIALGFNTWREIPWEDVEAFRYWEPTGIQMLVKRRQARWVGILLDKGLARTRQPWDVRFEIWLNTFHNRPGLCVLDPFVEAPILDVLQAFKDFAPRALDDYEWMNR